MLDSMGRRRRRSRTSRSSSRSASASTKTPCAPRRDARCSTARRSRARRRSSAITTRRGRRAAEAARGAQGAQGEGQVHPAHRPPAQAAARPGAARVAFTPALPPTHEVRLPGELARLACDDGILVFGSRQAIQIRSRSARSPPRSRRSWSQPPTPASRWSPHRRPARSAGHGRPAVRGAARRLHRPARPRNQHRRRDARDDPRRVHAGLRPRRRGRDRRRLVRGVRDAARHLPRRSPARARPRASRSSWWRFREAEVSGVRRTSRTSRDRRLALRSEAYTRRCRSCRWRRMTRRSSRARCPRTAAGLRRAPRQALVDGILRAAALAADAESSANRRAARPDWSARRTRSRAQAPTYLEAQRDARIVRATARERGERAGQSSRTSGHRAPRSRARRARRTPRRTRRPTPRRLRSRCAAHTAATRSRADSSPCTRSAPSAPPHRTPLFAATAARGGWGDRRRARRRRTRARRTPRCRRRSRRGPRRRYHSMMVNSLAWCAPCSLPRKHLHT